MVAMRTFAALLFLLFVFKTAGQNTDCPCCSEPYSAFDFWIGQWDVKDPSGKALGSNIIIKDLDQCILKESWTNSNGTFKGQSTNFYNREAGIWEQLWIDNSGSHLKLTGTAGPAKMTLSSEAFHGEDGREYFHRITWTHQADGTVRQLWEVVSGTTVERVEFEGIYRKI